jgi:hypothetical protein
MNSTQLIIAVVACGMSTLGVMTALLVHIIKYGEEKGAMRERVKRLEQEMIEQKEIRDTVMELRSTVTVLNGTVSEFRELLHTMWSQQGMPPFIVSRK